MLWRVSEPSTLADNNYKSLTLQLGGKAAWVQLTRQLGIRPGAAPHRAFK